MSESAAPRRAATRLKKTDYFKWASGVMVPIVVAASNTVKTPQGGIVVINYGVIAQQYQQVTGKALTDPGVTQEVQRGINLAKAGQYDAALTVFQNVSGNVKVPAVLSNVAALARQTGNAALAKQAVTEAAALNPDYGPVKENVAIISPPPKVGVDGQTGVDILNPISADLEKPISGRLDANSSVYYRFRMPKPPRDIYQVTVQNRGTTLWPGVKIYGPEKNLMTGSRF